MVLLIYLFILLRNLPISVLSDVRHALSHLSWFVHSLELSLLISQLNLTFRVSSSADYLEVMNAAYIFSP